MIDIDKDFALIMENIEGLFVIDTEEKILFMTDDLAKKSGFPGKDSVIGKPIKEVIPPGTNNLYKVLKSGKKQLSEIYFYDNMVIVSNGFPIYRNGELIAAFEYDVFQDTSLISGFMEKLQSIDSELNYYKKKYEKLKSNFTIDDLVGESKEIHAVKKKIVTIAKSDSPVVIQAETGCGKELVAHSIHKLSKRSEKRFVKINCASIPEHLFESEMFGYEEGSFTDAKKGGKQGKAELADGGTLFFDEIDQLPLSQQPKLLRFLQEKEIARVGSESDIHVNVRVIAASNRNLNELVQEGLFRSDLYFRLNVMKVYIPPLRERKEDIPILVDYFLEKANDELERATHKVEKVNKEVLDVFNKARWPGNVRELQNVLRSAVNDCYEKVLTVDYLESFILKNIADENHFPIKKSVNLDQIKEQAEADAIKRILDYYKGNKAKAAEQLNVSRQTLYNKMSRYFDDNKDGN